MTLYSTGCPRCKVLKTKLDSINAVYDLEIGTEKILELGFKSAPILEIDGKYYTFEEAVHMI